MLKFSSTSSTNVLINNNVSIYPNPAIDIITLAIDKPEDISAIQIFDIMGNEVYRDFNLEAKCFANKTVAIKLPLLYNGLYSLRILGDNSTEQKQFVVNFVDYKLGRNNIK